MHAYKFGVREAKTEGGLLKLQGQPVCLTSFRPTKYIYKDYVPKRK